MNGKLRITYKPRKKLPVSEWLKRQGRFSHLKKEEYVSIAGEIQKEVDEDWENLLKREALDRGQGTQQPPQKAE